ncbi:MAG: hypothetical protein U9P71_04140 [Campylobacterota bacterium]|nr:hypothetical protein [Campylobacterota bacterium]
MRKILEIITPLLYIIALTTVALTANIGGYEDFLKTMTQENGFFESVSVVLLLGIFAYGLFAIYMYKKVFNIFMLAAVGLFAFLAFLAAMEEISWGQHLFHFQSSSYFVENNLQKETNLHNFMNANLFSSIIYSTIYTVLVFLPLLYKIFLKKFNTLEWLHWFDINPHTILIVLFASSFQIYFYDDIGVVFDMVTLLAAVAMFGAFLFTQECTKFLKIHFGFILLSIGVNMLHYEIFNFFNMQYEIREMFVVLAAMLVFMELIHKQRLSHCDI